ncbi:MAG: hypothetical protein V5A14_03055 [Desulfohalobiaceae bacterium]
MEPTTLGLIAYLGLLTLAGSLVTGTMVSAFAAEAAYGLGRGKFRDKFGQQAAAMGPKVLLLFLLLVAPPIAWGLSFAEDPLGLALSPGGRVLQMALAPLLAGWLGMTVYSGSWVALRRSKGLHRLLGGASLLGLLAGLYTCLNIGAAWMLGDGTTASSLWRMVWLPVSWGVWPVWAALVGNGVGAAGVLGMGYLILRRNKDDFGRDYYRFALARAARWGLGLLLPVLIAAAWLGFRGVAWTPVLTASLAVVAIAVLALVLLSARVMRSRHPLRLKGEIIAACLLAWILDAALVYSLLLSAGVRMEVVSGVL